MMRGLGDAFRVKQSCVSGLLFVLAIAANKLRLVAEVEDSKVSRMRKEFRMKKSLMTWVLSVAVAAAIALPAFAAAPGGAAGGAGGFGGGAGGAGGGRGGGRAGGGA